MFRVNLYEAVKKNCITVVYYPLQDQFFLFANVAIQAEHGLP